MGKSDARQRRVQKSRQYFPTMEPKSRREGGRRQDKGRSRDTMRRDLAIIDFGQKLSNQGGRGRRGLGWFC